MNTKFRGFSERLNKWVYGYLLEDCMIINGIVEVNNEYISIERWETVVPESVGQYTGLNDSKCNEIYGDDIVLRKGKMYRIIFEIGSFMLSPIDDIDMDEEFINCWNDHVYPLSQLYFENGDLEDILSDLTIIGNIHENSELLEGE